MSASRVRHGDRNACASERAGWRDRARDGSIRGVGLALVQLAAARGAHVLAITSGSKGDAVRANGAEQVFNRDSPDILARIVAAAPAGLDVVADIAGGPGLSAMMPVLRDNGRWLSPVPWQDW